MNCFDYLATAKKYADKILEEYKILIRVDSNSTVSRGQYYQRHLEKLKEMVEFENLFYSKLAKCEVDFMNEKVLEKDFVFEYVSILDFSFQELESNEDALAWNRVGQKLSREQILKAYPDYHFDLEQIAMIPLTPCDFDNQSLDYLNKESIFQGCFNMAFSQYICFDSIYSSSMKTSCLYISSYMNSAIEAYYLNRSFGLEFQNQFQDIVQFIAQTYQDDSGHYYIASKEFYLHSFSGYIANALRMNDDMLTVPSTVLSIAILKDGLYTFAQIAPISVSNKIHTSLLRWEGNPFVKNYLNKAVMASLLERSEEGKKKQLSKEI